MEVCLVCEISSQGLNYGVKCCRACAAFFRRTNQMKLKYKCRLNKCCDLSQKNRYTCRRCRYQRCLEIGMAEGSDNKKLTSKKIGRRALDLDMPSTSSDGSETDNQIPSMEKSNKLVGVLDNGQLQRVPTSISHNECEPFSNKQIELKTRIDVLFSKSSRLQSFPYTIPLSLCQQGLVAYANHDALWPNCKPEKLVHFASLDVTRLLEELYTEVEHIASFCMSIQPFVELVFDQKWLVFKHFWPRFIEMNRVHVSCRLLGFDPDDIRKVCFDGSVVSRTSPVIGLDTITDLDEKEVKMLLRETDSVFTNWFTVPFKKFAPDEFELIYMALSVMWNVTGIPNISSSTIASAESVNCRLSDDLYNYYAYELNKPNFADRIYKLSHLSSALDRVHERRKEDSQMSKTFNIFKRNMSLDYLKF